MLNALIRAKKQTDIHAKASLYDILKDDSISDDERLTISKAFNDLLSDQEEKDIRIRQAILIGLFSFWEISLHDICEYYGIWPTTSSTSSKDKKPTKQSYKLYSYNYLNAIYSSKIPESSNLIESQIKELRNYMTHGCADSRRQAILDNLLTAYPEFHISSTNDTYYISDYAGLYNILKIISDELKDAENTAKNSKTTKK